MKKLLSIFLIILLLCTVHIGFVACDEKNNNQNNQGITLYEDRKRDALMKYIEATVFSFGTFNWINAGEYMSNDLYDDYPVLICSENEARNDTVDKIQEYYEKYKEQFSDVYLGEAGEVYINKDSVKVFTYADHIQKSIDELLNGFDVGDYVDDSSEIMHDMIHDSYKMDGHTFVFLSADTHMMPQANKPRAIIPLNFYTLITGENCSRTIVIVTRLGTGYGNMIAKLFEIATPDERHDIAKYYQAMHKEICTSWYHSEGGQNFLNYWNEYWTVNE